MTCTPRGGGSEFSPSRITEHADGSVWLSVPHNCSDGTTQRRRTCVDNCPVGAARTGTTVPGLRLEALAKIDPPLPGMRHSFDRPAANGQIRAIVLAETWWWSEGSYDPVVVRAEDGPLWVQVTATPGSMTIDPGDGSQPLVCPAPGVAYNRHASYYDQIPGERRGACVHVYGQTFNEVTATMAVTWTVTWEGYSPSQGSVGGTLAPMVRRQQVSFPVREIQSVIVY
ncbi:MAG: hypothetical protein KY462_13680 [Actinobacteria bacterium]|nr:hypothetical protein [Actinomycetota bacterium]